VDFSPTEDQQSIRDAAAAGVIDAWRMVVPKKVAAAQLAADHTRYPR
jgi:hypothetical protein